jgi:hypothetical protein
MSTVAEFWVFMNSSSTNKFRNKESSRIHKEHKAYIKILILLVFDTVCS